MNKITEHMFLDMNGLFGSIAKIKERKDCNANLSEDEKLFVKIANCSDLDKLSNDVSFEELIRLCNNFKNVTHLLELEKGATIRAFETTWNSTHRKSRKRLL